VHQVAVALRRKQLKELADGVFTSLPTAQAKAKELVGMTTS
jgi:hypothetical protein